MQGRHRRPQTKRQVSPGLAIDVKPKGVEPLGAVLDSLGYASSMDEPTPDGATPDTVVGDLPAATWANEATELLRRIDANKLAIEGHAAELSGLSIKDGAVRELSDGVRGIRAELHAFKLGTQDAFDQDRERLERVESLLRTILDHGAVVAAKQDEADPLAGSVEGPPEPVLIDTKAKWRCSNGHKNLGHDNECQICGETRK